MVSKRRTVVMLQPGYLPWIGCFEQIHRADVFVIYDDAQYTKQDWRNRNRVKANNGEAVYLTVPVKRCGTNTIISEVLISKDHEWLDKNMQRLKSYYEPALYFSEYFSVLERIFMKKHERLVDLTVDLFFALLDVLGLTREITFSSKLDTTIRGKKRLIAVSKELGGTHCYEGASGRNIYHPNEFLEQGITLEFQDFKCPQYPQLWGDTFIPNLSVVDVLFNCGQRAMDYIIAGGRSTS
jgi:hypothetical protein